MSSRLSETVIGVSMWITFFSLFMLAWALVKFCVVFVFELSRINYQRGVNRVARKEEQVQMGTSKAKFKSKGPRIYDW